MARLIVQHVNKCPVLINGEVKGTTNAVIRIDPGSYKIAPDDEDCEPREKELQVAPGTGPGDIVWVSFGTREPGVDRLSSPLYCCYNGFMLGQFMVASFINNARQNFPQRQSRMQEFLDEIGTDIAVPAWSPMDSADSVSFLKAVLDAILPVSYEIAGYSLLSSALMQWSLFEGEPRDQVRETVDMVVREQKLPEPDFDRFLARKDAHGNISMNSLLDPALAYLRQILMTIDATVEDQTAFVVMPFSSPFDSYYALYYRPALEAAGFRAMRAWGGLSSEHYAPMLQQLIRSCGLVLADVSREHLGRDHGQRNVNVFYEIGVAHAFGKRVIIVVDEADEKELPTNIGNAATLYSPRSEEWPKDAIQSTQGFIAFHSATTDFMPRAADLEIAIEDGAKYLEQIIIPQEARVAHVRAIELHRQGEYESAEREFDNAINLGNNATEVHFFRAMNRLKLSKFKEAGQDLDTVLERNDLEEVERKIGLSNDDSPGPHVGIRATALAQRGYTRQMLGKDDQAQDDYTAARKLGFPMGDNDR